MIGLHRKNQIQDGKKRKAPRIAGARPSSVILFKRSSGSMLHFKIVALLLTVVYLWHAILVPQRHHVIAMERNGGCVVGRQWGQIYLAATNLIDPLIN